MPSLMVFPTAEGPVPFEFPDGADEVEAFSSTDDSHVARSAERLEDALGLVARVGSSVREALAGLDAEASVTVGVKLAAEGGFIIAKSSAEASLTVTFMVGRKADAPVPAAATGGHGGPPSG